MVYNDAARPADHRVATSGVYENVFYDNESVTFPTVTGTATVTYEVRDYYGNIVASGPFSGTSLDLGVLPLGFYKLFFPRSTPLSAPYLNAGGEATFCVVRSTSPLKARPPANTGSAAADRLGNGFDMPMRGLVGAGPVRHQIRLDATNFSADLTGVLADIAYENSYRNSDTARPLFQFVAFPNGYDSSSPTEVANLATAVQQCVAAGVVYFEGQNEPNAAYGNDPTFYQTKFNDFCDAVHAAHASAKTMGPCAISLGGDWTQDGQPGKYPYLLLVGAGAARVDAFSFHNYSNGQGDLATMRKILDDTNGMLTAAGMAGKPRFNTEFGSVFASSNGVGDNRQQCKNILLDMHLLEQYDVPKEHAYLFYDRSHGFWGFPSWWIHAEGSEAMPTALVPLMRVWAEELFGKTFSVRLDFGSEDDMWLGTKFTGTDGSSVIALQSSGHVGTLDLAVTGASSVTTVDPFGNLINRSVVNGVVTIPVSELPSYVRLPNGASATSIPADWGIETFRAQSSTVSASTSANPAALAMDGKVDGSTSDWIGSALPAWWRVDFPKLTRFNRVTIFCSSPVNTTCTLVDFDIQVLQSGVWNTVATVTEPTPQKLWTSYKSAGATYIESYWSRRNQWTVRFDDAVAGDAIRIYIRSTSYGGSATPEAYNQNPGIGVGNQIGLSGPQVPELREVFCHLNEYDLAGKSTPNAPLVAIA